MAKARYEDTSAIDAKYEKLHEFGMNFMSELATYDNANRAFKEKRVSTLVKKAELRNKLLIDYYGYEDQKEVANEISVVANELNKTVLALTDESNDLSNIRNILTSKTVENAEIKEIYDELLSDIEEAKSVADETINVSKDVLDKKIESYVESKENAESYNAFDENKFAKEEIDLDNSPIVETVVETKPLEVEVNNEVNDTLEESEVKIDSMEDEKNEVDEEKDIIDELMNDLGNEIDDIQKTKDELVQAKEDIEKEENKVVSEEVVQDSRLITDDGKNASVEDQPIKVVNVESFLLDNKQEETKDEVEFQPLEEVENSIVNFDEQQKRVLGKAA